MSIRLDDEQLAELAQLIAREIRRETPGEFADAATVARMLGVQRRWVYDNASTLGGVKLPCAGGEKPRLRFELARVRSALAPADDAPAEAMLTPTPRRRRRAASVGTVLQSRPRP